MSWGLPKATLNIAKVAEFEGTDWCMCHIAIAHPAEFQGWEKRSLSFARSPRGEQQLLKNTTS